MGLAGLTQYRAKLRRCTECGAVTRRMGRHLRLYHNGGRKLGMDGPGFKLRGKVVVPEIVEPDSLPIANAYIPLPKIYR